jgi:DNA gyrase subunit B
VGSLRGRHGAELIEFVQETGLIGAEPTTVQELAQAVREGEVAGLSITVEGLDEEAGTVTARSVRDRTGEAHTVRIPLELYRGRELSSLRAVRGRLRELVGAPPFQLVRGARRREVASYEALRGAVLDLCREGVQLSRFKGLGEMNHDQLWETTMDPERRILQRVTMEDAVVAEELFSTLMGEKVEPRRDFIEQNSRQATLDI